MKSVKLFKGLTEPYTSKKYILTYSSFIYGLQGLLGRGVILVDVTSMDGMSIERESSAAGVGSKRSSASVLAAFFILRFFRALESTRTKDRLAIASWSSQTVPSATRLCVHGD